ncbi:YceI family protein [Hymenobacter terricola]|uniref:YceI family protein n=1 Tax=Hymenobacter terricola TaxID=2819236 RepID=UPI001B304182|nr:YceI family protein [Hymenobacter terricola]
MKYGLLLLFGLVAMTPAAQNPTTPQTPAAAAAAQAPAAALPGGIAGLPRYTTATGQITFFSSAPLEDIEALNGKVAAIFEMRTGELAFSMLMRDFQFKNTLMQEHFNENYAESEKYPRARFTGKLVTMPDEAQLRLGPQPVYVQGLLTIHNVKRKVRVPGTLQLRDNALVVTSKFSVAPADYKIKIPALVRNNIAKSIEISVILSCQPVAAVTASR